MGNKSCKSFFKFIIFGHPNDKILFFVSTKICFIGQGRAREQRGRGAEGLGYFRWFSSLTVTIKGEHSVHRERGGEGTTPPSPPKKKGKRKRKKKRKKRIMC